MKKDNFSFWCPLEINKAIDETTGEELMLLDGIASTADEDSDGEFLDPKGFDVKPLVERGFVNWHHQAKTNPGCIVGEPIEARIQKDGLYIKAQLYSNSQIANEIWDLAQTLEKNSKTRRLGWSIEGKVIKRKSDNPSSPDYKKIVKAVITGVAITHQPKNSKTFASIIKGDIDDDFEDEEERNDDTINKENEKKTKKEDKKALDTESAAALKKESVDDDVKVTCFGKSEVVERILGDIPGISIEKAENIFNLIQQIVMKKKSTKVITNDDIVKAYEALGLQPDEELIAKADAEQDDTSAAEEDADTDEDDADEGGEDANKKPAIKKGEDADDEETDETMDADDETQDEDEDSEENEEKPIKKGNVIERLGRIEKAIATSHLTQSKYIKALGVMLKDSSNKLQKASETIELAKSKIDEQAEIIKGQEQTILALTEQVEEYANGGAVPKSKRHAAPVERQFNKGQEDELNKGQNHGQLGENQVRISNKRLVSEILDQATFQKGFDDEFSKACVGFEATGQISQNVIDRLKAEYGIEIVK